MQHSDTQDEINRLEAARRDLWDAGHMDDYRKAAERTKQLDEIEATLPRLFATKRREKLPTKGYER